LNSKKEYYYDIKSVYVRDSVLYKFGVTAHRINDVIDFTNIVQEKMLSIMDCSF